MSEIKQVNVNGTDYTLKDETARNAVATKQDKLSAGDNIVITKNEAPEGYTQLKYVEANHHLTRITIDNCITLAQGDNLEFIFEATNMRYTDHGKSGIFSGFSTASSVAYNNIIADTTVGTGGHWILEFDSVSLSIDKRIIPLDVGHKHIVSYKANLTTSGEVLMDEKTMFYSNPQYNKSRSLGIHCKYTSQGVFACEPEIRYYGVKQTSSLGVVKFNLIPVRRNSDGAIGMYETVTNVFYQADNTIYPFVAGPEMIGKDVISAEVGDGYISFSLNNSDAGGFYLNDKTGTHIDMDVAIPEFNKNMYKDYDEYNPGWDACINSQGCFAVTDYIWEDKVSTNTKIMQMTYGPDENTQPIMHIAGGLCVGGTEGTPDGYGLYITDARCFNDNVAYPLIYRNDSSNNIHLNAPVIIDENPETGDSRGLTVSGTTRTKDLKVENGLTVEGSFHVGKETGTCDVNFHGATLHAVGDIQGDQDSMPSIRDINSIHCDDLITNSVHTNDVVAYGHGTFDGDVSGHNGHFDSAMSVYGTLRVDYNEDDTSAHEGHPIRCSKIEPYSGGSYEDDEYPCTQCGSGYHPFKEGHFRKTHSNLITPCDHGFVYGEYTHNWGEQNSCLVLGSSDRAWFTDYITTHLDDSIQYWRDYSKQYSISTAEGTETYYGWTTSEAGAAYTTVYTTSAQAGIGNPTYNGSGVEISGGTVADTHSPYASGTWVPLSKSVKIFNMEVPAAFGGDNKKILEIEYNNRAYEPVKKFELFADDLTRLKQMMDFMKFMDDDIYDFGIDTSIGSPTVTTYTNGDLHALHLSYAGGVSHGHYMTSDYIPTRPLFILGAQGSVQSTIDWDDLFCEPLFTPNAADNPEIYPYITAKYQQKRRLASGVFYVAVLDAYGNVLWAADETSKAHLENLTLKERLHIIGSR